MPLGDVTEHEHHALNRTIRVADGSSAVIDRMLTAVFGNEDGVVRQSYDLAFSENLGDGVFNRLTRLLIDDTEYFGERAPFCLKIAASR